jgi:poly-beta-1,6-N-acetyl-D-glucosamine synthase
MARKITLGILLFVVIVFVFISYVTVLRTDYAVTSTFVNISMVLLLSFLVILIFRFFVLIYVSYLHHMDRIHVPDRVMDYINSHDTSNFPTVTIVVPCFNEGVVIERSIESLLELHYPSLEIVVVDDGSSDDTFERALRYKGHRGNAVVNVLHQKNAGKAAALNHGIRESSGELVMTVDADSRLDPASLLYVVPHFENPKVGAVAGNVKVVNRHNLITKMQALEYVEGLNMVRRSQGYFSAVNVIPGPLGIFRRKVLEDVGLYDSDTFAEDCDITIKILAKRWKIEYEPYAITWTEAPETVNAFFRQRYRWTRGILQSLRKHAKSLRGGSGPVNTFVMWYMGFEALLWPVINIFAQIYFLYIVLIFDMSIFVIFWWGQLTILDIVVAMFCLSMEHEDMKLAPYAVLYRIYFVLLTDVCKVIATVEEFLQVGMTWGKLERTGKI